MNYFKSAAMAAFGLAAFGLVGVFTGCSESSSGSNDEVGTVPSVGIGGFEVSSCNADVDEKSAVVLEANKEDLVDYFKALSGGDLSQAQYFGAKVKASYGQVLADNPANCEAQLGYALSSIANVINNDDIKALIDTLKNEGVIKGGESGYNLYKISGEEVSQIVVGSRVLAKEADNKSVIVRAQDAIAQSLLPVIDSAITYMTNVVRRENVTVVYDGGNRPVELDNGEFAPALGALYLIRALMVGIVAIDRDFSENGSFDWIFSLKNIDFTNYKTHAGINKVMTLMDVDNSYNTVKAEWVDAYAAIPEMLDSAISYVQLGLQYGIDEAANGLASQANDIYVVGSGEDADVSVADMQKAIDSLDRIKDALYGDFDFVIKGRRLVVNLGRFFKITNTKKYLPYYKMVDPSDWYKPSTTDYWTEKLPMRSYASRELEDLMDEQIAGEKSAYENVFVILNYSSNNVFGSAEALHATTYAISKAGDLIVADYKVELDGCNANLVYSEDYDDCEIYGSCPSDRPKLNKLSYTISPEFCKVENGVAQYLMNDVGIIPNVFNFTDANGNVTLSYRDLMLGVVEYNELWGQYRYVRDYTTEELKKLIIWPDVTFAGMFPEMTLDEFWDWFDFLAGRGEYDL